MSKIEHRKLRNEIHNHNSLHSQKNAAKKLLEAGFSKKEILETLFKYSPVISDKDELKKYFAFHSHKKLNSATSTEFF